MSKSVIGLAAERSVLALAVAHRRVFRSVKLVGVTGSCGKTTTATLVSAVLSRRGPVRNGAITQFHYTNKRTALSVIKTRPPKGYCVAEFSAYEPGVMRFATEYLRPDIGIVTHIKSDHYTSYRDLDATAEEKSRLITSLPPNGLAILNTDDERVWRMRGLTQAAVVGIGASEDATLRLKHAHAAWPERLTLQVEFQGSTFAMRTRFVDEQSAFPVLAALAAGISEGVPLSEAVSAIEAAEPVDGRMAPHIASGGVTIIDDSWKAPLYSIESKLQFLRAARANRKIMVIGTLSDFPGSKSRRYRAVVDQALAVADIVCVVGRWAGSVSKLQGRFGAERLAVFETLESFNAYFKTNVRPGDLVLLKGSSRADHFERIVLDRKTPVTCWRQGCRRRRHCETCELLRHTENA